MMDDRIKRLRKYAEDYNNVDLDEAADDLETMEAVVKAARDWKRATPGASTRLFDAVADLDRKEGK